MKLILGTMTFGQQVEKEIAKEMCTMFLSKGFHEVDTAYVYNDGKCEKMIGEILPALEAYDVQLATKVNPRVTGRLDKEAVDMQIKESLERMNVTKVDTLYLHFPDYNTLIESALEAVNSWYEKKTFKRLGLSNFPAWLVIDVLAKCEKNGWVKPSVYEGLYNVLGRNVERELFDALHAYHISFHAYNPLAGGLLTGKYKGYETAPEAGRFKCRPTYHKRYWKKSYFDAVKVIQNACDEHGISIVTAAIKWLAYHSELKVENGDGIIMGASSCLQLEQNINGLNGDKLPEAVVNAMEEAWELCKADSPEYFRYYGV